MVHLRVLGNKVNTLLDVLLEVLEGGSNELLLVGVELTQAVDLLDTLGAEGNLGREEVNTLVLVERGLDKGGLNNLLTLLGLDQRSSHAGTGLSHGESGGTSTILSLDNLITTKLDTVNKGIESLAGDVGVTRLGDQRNNSVTRVTTDNGDSLLSGVSGLDLRDEAGSTDDVKGGDTEKLLGVVDTLGLEDLSNNGDSGVDGVGDDENLGLRRELSNSLGEITDNGGIGVEKIITGHAGLSGDTSGNDNNLGTREGLLKSTDLGGVSRDLGVGGDVRQISGDTGGSSQIVELKTSDVLVELEQQGEGLANTTSSTKNGDLSGLIEKLVDRCHQEEQ